MAQPVPDAYLEVRVTVPVELVDAVSDFVIVNIASGLVLEEEEAATETDIIFYVPEEQTQYREQLERFLAYQVPAAISEIPQIRQKRVENTEWLERYRDSVQAIRLGDDLIIRPTWIAPTDDRYQLIVEPKMAFGTGSHATTRSCLKIIRDNFKPGMRFLDMGCGSGILSILADKMEASFIKAVDYDLAAVANCRENFDINQVTVPYEIIVGSIEKCQGDKPYDFLCSNIIRTTIMSMLDSLLKLLAPDGMLVLSGLLDKDDEIITAALRERGQDDFSIMRDEEWLTYSVRIG